MRFRVTVQQFSQQRGEVKVRGAASVEWRVVVFLGHRRQAGGCRSRVPTSNEWTAYFLTDPLLSADLNRCAKSALVPVACSAATVMGVCLVLFEPRARAQDNYEIQVYGSDIVPAGKTMVELHSNFALRGRREAEDGLLPTDHALFGLRDIAL